MKVFFINENKTFTKEIEIKNNNNRFLIYKELKKCLKSKLKDFFLFYNHYNNDELSCIIETNNFIDDFELISNKENQNINEYLLYKKSINIAKEFHKKQKYDNFLPYFYHLKKVDKIIDYFFYELPKDKIFTLKICAILHDILEDTNYSAKNIQEIFGNEIKIIIQNLTKNKLLSLFGNKNIYINKVTSHPLSTYVKIADKIVNTKQTIKNKRIKYIKKYSKSNTIFLNRIKNNFKNKNIFSFLEKANKQLKICN